jgi:hypothetical protein
MPEPEGKFRTQKSIEKVQISFLSCIFLVSGLFWLALHYINDYLY